MYNHRGKRKKDGREYGTDFYNCSTYTLTFERETQMCFSPHRQHQSLKRPDSGNNPHHRQLCHPEQRGIYLESSQHFTGSPAGSGKGAETQGRQGAQAQRRAGCAD